MCHFFVCFRTYLYVLALFRKMLRRSTQEGRPDTGGRGLGAMRALWSAWQALKFFFPPGVDKTFSGISA